MGTGYLSNLPDARDKFKSIISNGAKAGKITMDDQMAAEGADISVSTDVDGWFTSDEEEAQGYWTGLQIWAEDAILSSGGRLYFKDCIDAMVSGEAAQAKTEAEASYTAQAQAKVEQTVQKADDTLVGLGKDPSTIYAIAGGLAGLAVATVFPAVPFVNAVVVPAAGAWTVGKLKAWGVL